MREYPIATLGKASRCKNVWSGWMFREPEHYREWGEELEGLFSKCFPKMSDAAVLTLEEEFIEKKISVDEAWNRKGTLWITNFHLPLS